MRYVQTYVDLTTEHIIRGVLNKFFFCGPIMKICPVFTYRTPLQDYVSRVKLYAWNSASGESYADAYYRLNIKGKDVKSTPSYQILHLSNLNIDTKYTEGAETDCGEFRCCHLRLGQNATEGEDRAGPFGSKGCDLPLEAMRQMLIKLKEAAVADYAEINMVVVTGNVVTHQPG